MSSGEPRRDELKIPIQFTSTNQSLRQLDAAHPGTSDCNVSLGVRVVGPEGLSRLVDLLETLSECPWVRFPNHDQNGQRKIALTFRELKMGLMTLDATMIRPLQRLRVYGTSTPRAA